MSDSDMLWKTNGPVFLPGPNWILLQKPGQIIIFHQPRFPWNKVWDSYNVTRKLLLAAEKLHSTSLQLETYSTTIRHQDLYSIMDGWGVKSASSIFG